MSMVNRGNDVRQGISPRLRNRWPIAEIDLPKQRIALLPSALTAGQIRAWQGYVRPLPSKCLLDPQPPPDPAMPTLDLQTPLEHFPQPRLGQQQPFPIAHMLG
jgi:hypothetical protein